MTPTLLADYACVCGENPLWHPLEKVVYWTDIPTGRLFRCDPASGKHEICYQGRPVGGFTIQANGELLLFMDRGTVMTWRDGRMGRIILEEIPAEREGRFNDVIADPAGRVFCGTLHPGGKQGRLYRLDPDGQLTRLLDRLGCANGMGFSPPTGAASRRIFYFTDSVPRTIDQYDYDPNSGAIANPRPFVHSVHQPGVPDGMTVDLQGNVWSARWDGWRLTQYDPAGNELQSVAFPVKKVSSVVFGGQDCTDMFVTTAGGDKKDVNGAQAGGLFHLKATIPGLPEYFSRIGL